MENSKLYGLFEEDLDEDFILIQHSCESEDFAKDFAKDFKLDDLSDQECLAEFRFERDDLISLVDELELPEKMVCQNGIKVGKVEALCVILRRLTYPNRLCDLKRIFRRSVADLSYIVNITLHTIHDRHAQLLSSLQQPWLEEDNVRQYAAAIHNAGAPLDNCWGFIDGTLRPMCRPSVDQRIVFNGQKRVHGLKFQSVVLPNGLIANIYGPMEGKRHDSGMLRRSGLLTQLEQHMTAADGTVLSLYGDPAYPLRPHLIAPFRGAILTPDQQAFNKAMSALRVCVEWGFGKVVNLFAFLDFKKNLKLYLQPVGLYYKVGVLLTNCQTCLYGSITGARFGMDKLLTLSYMNEYDFFYFKVNFRTKTNCLYLYSI